MSRSRWTPRLRVFLTYTEIKTVTPFQQAFTHIKQCVTDGVDFDSELISQLVQQRNEELQRPNRDLRNRERNWLRQIETMLKDSGLL